MPPSEDSDMDEERNLLGSSVSVARGVSPRGGVFDPDGDSSAGSHLKRPGASSINASHGYAPTPIHTQIQPSTGATSNLYRGQPMRVHHYKLAALAMYWFGWSFLWLPLLIVIIPFQVSNTPAAASGRTRIPLIGVGADMRPRLLSCVRSSPSLRTSRKVPLSVRPCSSGRSSRSSALLSSAAGVTAVDCRWVDDDRTCCAASASARWR
jgi:hypothetical protein